MKGFLKIAERLILDGCDALAHERLLEAEAVGTLSLDGRADDPNRAGLVNGVMSIIKLDLLAGIAEPGSFAVARAIHVLQKL